MSWHTTRTNIGGRSIEVLYGGLLCLVGFGLAAGVLVVKIMMGVLRHVDE